jgi:hypothetical protein
MITSFVSRSSWGYETDKKVKDVVREYRVPKLTSKEAISLRPSWIFWESMSGSSSSAALRREYRKDYRFARCRHANIERTL